MEEIREQITKIILRVFDVSDFSAEVTPAPENFKDLADFLPVDCCILVHGLHGLNSYFVHNMYKIWYNRGKEKKYGNCNRRYTCKSRPNG